MTTIDRAAIQQRGIMLVHKEFSEPVATILNDLSEEELKKRIITENGMTLAQEEEILSLDLKDTTGPMSVEDFVDELKSLRNTDD